MTFRSELLRLSSRLRPSSCWRNLQGPASGEINWRWDEACWKEPGEPHYPPEIATDFTHGERVHARIGCPLRAREITRR